MTKTRGLFAFSVAAIAGVALATPKNADANFRRLSGSGCQVVYGINGGTWTAYNNLSGIINNGPTSSGLFVSCPVVDDTDMPHQSLNGIAVDVVNPTGATSGSWATACVMSYAGTTGACGGNSYANSSGWNSLGLDLTALKNSSYDSWYPTIGIDLAGGAALMGYLEY
jgi:hypothetical protein